MNDARAARKRATRAERSPRSGVDDTGALAVDSMPPLTLVDDLRELIRQTRQQLAASANSALTRTYWLVGERIRREILGGGQRADYGQKIVKTLAARLEAEFGRGFSPSALSRMIAFVDAFPDPEIVATLSQELSWSHFVVLLPLKQPLEREFYAELCRIERWSLRTLRERIASQLYLRSAVARQPEAAVRAELGHLRTGGQMSPDLVFRDPYLLDFLGLPEGFSERDLEAAVLREMERFLLELGAGFTFVARQKRIPVGKDDFHLDLLFYHSRSS